MVSAPAWAQWASGAPWVRRAHGAHKAHGAHGSHGLHGVHGAPRAPGAHGAQGAKPHGALGAHGAPGAHRALMGPAGPIGPWVFQYMGLLIHGLACRPCTKNRNVLYFTAGDFSRFKKTYMFIKGLEAEGHAEKVHNFETTAINTTIFLRNR